MFSVLNGMIRRVNDAGRGILLGISHAAVAMIALLAKAAAEISLAGPLTGHFCARARATAGPQTRSDPKAAPAKK